MDFKTLTFKATVELKVYIPVGELEPSADDIREMCDGAVLGKNGVELVFVKVERE